MRDLTILSPPHLSHSLASLRTGSRPVVDNAKWTSLFVKTPRAVGCFIIDLVFNHSGKKLKFNASLSFIQYF